MRSLLFAALLDVAFSQQVHIIDVSNRANAPTFSPGNINIPLGDVVQFQFQGGNHSAKQSAFDTPCQAVPGGFDSGFQPFKGAVVPVFTFAINNTDPIYYFSGSPGDCERGMVGGINGPSTGNTVQAYQAAAFKLAPPSNSSKTSTPKSTIVPTIISSLTSSSPTSSATQSTIPTLSASNSNTTSPMAENHCDNCLPTAVIVGIAIGVVSVVLMAMGLWRMWKRKKDISRRDATLGNIRMVTEEDIARFKMMDSGFEEQPVEVRGPPKRPKRPERVSKWVA